MVEIAEVTRRKPFSEAREESSGRAARRLALAVPVAVAGLLGLLKLNALQHPKASEPSPPDGSREVLPSDPPRIADLSGGTGPFSLDNSEASARWLARPEPLDESVRSALGRYLYVAFAGPSSPQAHQWDSRVAGGQSFPRLWVEGEYDSQGIVYLVLEDSEGNQHRVKPRAGDGNPELLFVLPRDAQFEKLGVEFYHPGNARSVSAQALKEAEEQVLPAFPLATVGEPFQWELRFPEGSHSSREYLGKVLIIEHWATYCLYCVQGVAPRIEALQREQPDRIAVIAVNVDSSDRANLALEHTKAFPKEWLNLFVRGDSPHMSIYGRAISGRPNLGGIPFVVVVDQSGKVAYVGSFQDDEKVKNVIGALLGNAPHE